MVLDNALIHHNDEIVRMIKSKGAIVLYTAPYFPELNPIEYMFGKYKMMLKRFNHLDWVTCHMMALTSVTPEDAGSFFCHCEIPNCDHFKKMLTNCTSLDEEVAALAASAAAVATVVWKKACMDT